MKRLGNDASFREFMQEVLFIGFQGIDLFLNAIFTPICDVVLSDRWVSHPSHTINRSVTYSLDYHGDRSPPPTTD